MVTDAPKKTVYIAMYNEYGDSADFKPYVFGIFFSYEDAKVAVQADMRDWAAGLNIDIDDDMLFNFRVCNGEGNIGCQWNIEKYEM